MTDIHNHLLFGVDDGSISIEESISVLREMSKAGYKNVILTPHYIKDSNFNSSAKENFRRLKILREAVKENGIDIKLFLGNEIYMDDDIYELLMNGEVYSLNGSSFILVELPMNGEYSNYLEIFKDLIRKGCHIILAHPERYIAFQKNYDLLLELEGIGVFFQCNLDSLIGKYGNEACKMLKRMLKEKKVAFFATDIHHKKHNYSDWAKAKEIALTFLNESEFDTLVKTNPEQLIA